MSERKPPTLTFSTQNLSVDGTRVVPDFDKKNLEITEAAALAALKAFEALPVVDMVDIEVKVYLAGPRGRVAVQNIGGKLMVTLTPEAMNTPAVRTPEETLAQVLPEPTAPAAAGTGPAPSTTSLLSAEGDAPAEAVRQPKSARDWLNSPWMLAALVLVAVVVAYFSFSPDTPEGVVMIRDPARVASLHAEFDGRYGAPAANALELNHGKITGWQPSAKGTAEEKLFEMTYRFGERDNEVVAVVDNGAVLERQPDRSLKFLESVYPRQ